MLKKGFGNFIMNNDKEFLATEPIGKLLLRLAIPTLAAQMINMLYNIIDDDQAVEGWIAYCESELTSPPSGPGRRPRVAPHTGSVD